MGDFFSSCGAVGGFLTTIYGFKCDDADRVTVLLQRKKTVHYGDARKEEVLAVPVFCCEDGQVLDMSDKEKHPVGRPTKYRSEFVEQAKQFCREEGSTDEQLAATFRDMDDAVVRLEAKIPGVCGGHTAGQRDFRHPSCREQPPEACSGLRARRDHEEDGCGSSTIF